MVLDNEQIKARKEALRKEIERLKDKISNPSAFRTADGQPYVLSPMFEEDKKKFEEIVAEYNSLVESFDVATLTMKRIIHLADGRFTLKYRPEFNRWDFYDGNQYKGSNVEFLDEDNAKITIPTQNSDTHGETVNYVYTIKIAPTINATVAKLAQPKPCTKVEEGLAMMQNPDDALMESMGYVKDPIAENKWRKQTPLEYDEKLKQQQKKPAKTKKDSKCLFGGKFHFKR